MTPRLGPDGLGGYAITVQTAHAVSDTERVGDEFLGCIGFDFGRFVAAPVSALIGTAT